MGTEELDVRKIAADLKKYEESSARGGLRIEMPLTDALRAMAKTKPENKKRNSNASANKSRVGNV